MNRLRLLVVALLAGPAVWSPCPPARAGDKLALVVGAADALPGDLPAVAHADDAAGTLSDAFRGLGFDVTTMAAGAENERLRPGSAAAILREAERLFADRSPDDSVVLTFSGRGVRLGDGLGDGDEAAAAGNAIRATGLCPSRTNPTDPSTLVPVSRLLELAARCGSRQKLIVLDIDRDEREPEGGGHPAGPAAAVAEVPHAAPPDTIVLLACQPGEKAHALPRIQGSIYGHHLVRFLRGDGPPEAYPDGAATVAGLVPFVRGATAASTAKLLDRSQTPQALLPADAVPTWSLGTPRVAAPAAGPRGVTLEENPLGMKLVRIEAGEFLMGSNHKENERPVHRVRITRPFLLGQTEVTQGQFEKVTGTTPWRGLKNVKEGPDRPASYVSWEHAVEFCRQLTEGERRAGRLAADRSYRLPTEAEWEYACRAATRTTWSFGDEERFLGEHGWFRGNTVDGGEPEPHDVGLKKANSWGLLDMHGNVNEWCGDWQADDSYRPPRPDAVISDPRGPSAGGSFRIIRGGGWYDGPIGCRSAVRYLATPSTRQPVVGFRVVCEIE